MKIMDITCNIASFAFSVMVVSGLIRTFVIKDHDSSSIMIYEKVYELTQDPEIKEYLDQQGKKKPASVAVIKDKKEAIRDAFESVNDTLITNTQDNIPIPNDTIGSLSDSIGVVNDSIGVVSDSIGVVSDSIGVVNDSIGVVNDSIGVVNDTIPIHSNGDTEDIPLPIDSTQDALVIPLTQDRDSIHRFPTLRNK